MKNPSLLAVAASFVLGSFSSGCGTKYTTSFVPADVPPNLQAKPVDEVKVLTGDDKASCELVTTGMLTAERAQFHDSDKEGVIASIRAEAAKRV